MPEVLAAVLVPLAPFLMVCFIVWTRHRERLLRHQSEHDARLHSEETLRLTAHNRQLEERLRTLEAIVTDKGYDVATQIESLRHQPASRAGEDAPHA